MTDQGDDLAELRESIDVSTQQYEKAARTTGPVTGADASGTVQVRIDAQGAPHDVVVRDGWASHHGPAGLGAAVLEAYGNAGAERARLWGEATAATLDEPAPRARPAATGVESLAGRLRELAAESGDRVDVRRSIQELTEVLRSVNSQLDTAFDQVAARAAAEHEARSAAGHVTAAVNGAGILVRVEADEVWAGRTHPFNLSRELTEALSAAVQAAARAVPEQPFDGTALEDAARLFADPDALARRAGLVRD
jgi:DNA-binding protein YbaB